MLNKLRSVLDTHDEAQNHMQLVKELLEEVEDTLRWRDVKKEPPPKDGKLIVLYEGDNNYTIVRWVENDDLAGDGGGGWYIASSVATAFLLDEDIGWMLWRPFVQDWR